MFPCSYFSPEGMYSPEGQSSLVLSDWGGNSNNGFGVSGLCKLTIVEGDGIIINNAYPKPGSTFLAQIVARNKNPNLTSSESTDEEVSQTFWSLLTLGELKLDHEATGPPSRAFEQILTSTLCSVSGVGNLSLSHLTLEETPSPAQVVVRKSNLITMGKGAALYAPFVPRAAAAMSAAQARLDLHAEYALGQGGGGPSLGLSASEGGETSALPPPSSERKRLKSEAKRARIAEVPVAIVVRTHLQFTGNLSADASAGRDVPPAAFCSK